MLQRAASNGREISREDFYNIMTKKAFWLALLIIRHITLDIQNKNILNKVSAGRLNLAWKKSNFSFILLLSYVHFNKLKLLPSFFILCHTASSNSLIGQNSNLNIKITSASLKQGYCTFSKHNWTSFDHISPAWVSSELLPALFAILVVSKLVRAISTLEDAKYSYWNPQATRKTKHHFSSRSKSFSTRISG